MRFLPFIYLYRYRLPIFGSNYRSTHLPLLTPRHSRRYENKRSQNGHTGITKLSIYDG
jgi:hypothetical protein